MGIGNRAACRLRCPTGAAIGVLMALTAAAAAPEEGFHWKPGLGFSQGDHQADLRLEFRYRWEGWKAFATEADDFHGMRTRFALDYRFRDVVRLFAQGQQTAVLGLTGNASGAGRLYRTHNGGDDDPSSVRPSQLFLQLNPAEGSWVRLGREYVNMGTLIPYKEPDWRFLKIERMSQRLFGTVDWSQGARAYDGLEARLGLRGHQIHLFAVEPTTGVFVVDDEAYKRLKKVISGGLEWTAPRGTLFDQSEVGAFFVAYADGRDPADVAFLFGDIELYTLGASWLGVYPLGPGRADALLWGAFQFGDYVDAGPVSGTQRRDQRAGAVIAEFGYRLPEVFAKPWLRAGVNYASGDGDLDDGKRTTFFNILPTNHLYYGYTDQLALQNLIDLLLQLRLAPLKKLGLDLTYHRFWLAKSDDFRWAGTGAFSRASLGYVPLSSNGSTDVGHELDVVVSYSPLRGVSLAAGFARLWGGSVFNGSDVDFGYVQLVLKY